MVLIAAIVGLLMYVNHLDLIGKNYFTSNLSALILVGIIIFTLFFSFINEKKFATANTTVYELLWLEPIMVLKLALPFFHMF
jgi:succinate dehydrogenase hydrophobic anchor subunit